MYHSVTFILITGSRLKSLTIRFEFNSHVADPTYGPSGPIFLTILLLTDRSVLLFLAHPPWFIMAGDTSLSSQEKSKGEARPQLPPGMVMGPDGKPCKICTAFRNWKPGTTNYTEPDSYRHPNATRKAPNPPAKKSERVKFDQDTKNVVFPGVAGIIATGATAPNQTDVQEKSVDSRPDEPPPGCPPDIEQLGRATWTFLHTTAAYYPEKPTPTQRANMIMLLRSLPVLYACGWCAADFGKDLQSHPPQVGSRQALSQWLCERHNEVNAKLGKEMFDCATVDERWKDGPSDGRCD